MPAPTRTPCGSAPRQSRASPAPAGSATASCSPAHCRSRWCVRSPRHTARRGSRVARRSGRKPRVAALRNLWITTDAAERAAVLDWQRASYVLYQGLGWTVAESDAGAAMDFAGDAARAIETAVATTIIGSVEEVIDGLHEVADAGVDDVVLRIAVEGAPQAAIHTVMQRLRRRRVPGSRRRQGGAVRLGVTLSPSDEAELARAAESVGIPFVHLSGEPGTESTIAATVVVATTTVRVIVGIHVGDEHPGDARRGDRRARQPEQRPHRRDRRARLAQPRRRHRRRLRPAGVMVRAGDRPPWEAVAGSGEARRARRSVSGDGDAATGPAGHPAVGRRRERRQRRPSPVVASRRRGAGRCRPHAAGGTGTRRSWAATSTPIVSS